MKKIILTISALALIAIGCNQATKKQAEENIQNETITMPSQSYVGLWHTADNPPDDLTILEIGNDEIRFEVGFFRNYSANGTAKIESNEIIFVNDNDKSGTMKFNENSISLIIDDFEYNFPVKIKKKQTTGKVKVKYSWQYDDYAMLFFDDGIAQGIRLSLGIPSESESSYEEYPTYLFLGEDRREFFDEQGHIKSHWKMINYHEINSPMQITNFETNTKKIAKSNIQNITETCLIIIRPKFDSSPEEEGDPAADWDYYAYETGKRYEAVGIKTVYANKQYLSFALSSYPTDDEKFVIDTKKEQNAQFPPSALLYRKGDIPIMISISGDSDEDTEHIEEYLRESGDGIIFSENQTSKITNKDVRKHCENFIHCIKSGKLKQSLTYFAPKYVKEQHDDFLDGRTSQFLREFLAGNSLTGEEFIVPKNLSDIKSIKIRKAQVKPNETEAEAIFEIELITGVKYSVELYMSIDNANRLYFWGAVG